MNHPSPSSSPHSPVGASTNDITPGGSPGPSPTVKDTNAQKKVRVTTSDGRQVSYKDIIQHHHIYVTKNILFYVFFAIYVICSIFREFFFGGLGQK